MLHHFCDTDMQQISINCRCKITWWITDESITMNHLGFLFVSLSAVQLSVTHLGFLNARQQAATWPIVIYTALKPGYFMCCLVLTIKQSLN